MILQCDEPLQRTDEWTCLVAQRTHPIRFGETCVDETVFEQCTYSHGIDTEEEISGGGSRCGGGISRCVSTGCRIGLDISRSICCFLIFRIGITRSLAAFDSQFLLIERMSHVHVGITRHVHSISAHPCAPTPSLTC